MKTAGLTLLNFLIILYIVKDDGPFDIFKFIRYMAGINVPIDDVFDDETEYESDGGTTAKLLSCHRCFGFWSGLVIAAISKTTLYEKMVIIGGGILLHEYNDR